MAQGLGVCVWLVYLEDMLPIALCGYLQRRPVLGRAGGGSVVEIGEGQGRAVVETGWRAVADSVFAGRTAVPGREGRAG